MEGDGEEKQGNRRPTPTHSMCSACTRSAASHATPCASSPSSGCACRHPHRRARRLPLPRGTREAVCGADKRATRPATRPRDRWRGNAAPHSRCRRRAHQGERNARKAACASGTARQPPAACCLPAPSPTTSPTDPMRSSFLGQGQRARKPLSPACRAKWANEPMSPGPFRAPCSPCSPAFRSVLPSPTSSPTDLIRQRPRRA